MIFDSRFSHNVSLGCESCPMDQRVAADGIFSATSLVMNAATATCHAEGGYKH